MRKRFAGTSRHDTFDDVGTLWMMRRRDRTARCALMSWPAGFEVRVLVDGETLLTERCDRAGDAFVVADRWKQRMLARGWYQVIPSSRGQLDGSSCA
jgi:hypothetical protein